MPLRISEYEWNKLYPRTCVALNPTPAEAIRLVRSIQNRCRVNFLNDDQVTTCLESVTSGRTDLVGIGLRSCRPSSKYGIDTTLLQIVRLDDHLIGLITKREHIEPPTKREARRRNSSKLKPGFEGYPVSKEKGSDPVGWYHAVVRYFWLHLNDQTIERLRQGMIAEVMRQAAIRSKRRARRDIQRFGLRRHLQVRTLFNSWQETYISELTMALDTIADELITEEKSLIRWADFQRRWASISARYRRDLLGLQKNGRLSLETLRSFKDFSNKYWLTFDYWRGGQRIFPTEQIVFQINIPAQVEAWTKGNKTERQVTKTMKEAAEVGSHPVRETTVGWLRVHVDDDHRICFVDEVQSDLLEHLRHLQEEPAHAASANAMARQVADWNMHGFAAVARWSRMIGYRVAMHSPETASRVPGYTPSERKWNTYYAPLIKRFGLEALKLKRKYGGTIHCAPPPGAVASDS